MNVKQLRNFAIANSLFKPTSLKKALDTLGFVQADPIRAPARAQDLILRHRVKNYHAGDLEAQYSRLDLDEDFLYAYGYFSPRVRPLLHPKNKYTLTATDKKLLSFIQTNGKTHPQELDVHFGKQTEKNWWGGSSKVSKIALENLHYYGFLRIAGREKGIRVYETVTPPVTTIPELERIEMLTMLIISILQPITEPRLTGALNYLRYFYFDKKMYTAKGIVESLLSKGQVTREKVDGISYIWNPKDIHNRRIRPEVRFLAPFDPLVWDRTRFEHFWRWPYRFEAYVPAAKRLRGYYSLPLLWKEDIIGWVNAKNIGGRVNCDIGYVNKKPDSLEYNEALTAEIERMNTFLN